MVFGDEWAFIITRRQQFSSGHYADYLFAAHNGHWSTLPVLLHALLFKVFGLHTYMPYLAGALAAHVAVVALVRLMLMRLGLSPWHALAGSSVILLLGSGAESLAFGFQVGFTAAVAFGLCQLLLADHPSPGDGRWFGRRDLLGIVFAICGLMCSGTAIPVVIAVGVTLAIKGRWRLAALHVGVPAIVYLAWYAKYGASPDPAFHIDQMPPYTYRGLTAAIENLTQFKGAGGVLVLMVVLSAAFIGKDEVRRTAAAWGCAVGAIALFALASIDRSSLGIEQSVSSRYAYVAGVLLLPSAIIVIREAVARLRTPIILVAVLLGWALVGNVANLLQFERERLAITEPSRATIQAAAAIARQPGIDPAAIPDPTYAVELSMGSLGDLVRSGALPPPRVSTTALLQAQSLYLAHFAVVALPALASASAAGAPLISSVVDATTSVDASGCVTVHPAGATPQIEVTIADRAGFTIESAAAGNVTMTLRTAASDAVSTPRVVPIAAGQLLAVTIDLGSVPTFDLPVGGDSTLCGLTAG